MVPKQRQEASHTLPKALDTWGLPLLTHDGGDAPISIHFLNLLCSVGRDIVFSLMQAFHKLTFQYFVTDREQFKDTNKQVSSASFSEFNSPLCAW